MTHEKSAALFACNDYRWRHLYFVAERILKLSANAESGQLVKDIKSMLESLHEAFPKELDPAVDPEGFALRRFVRAMFAAVERIQSEILNQEEIAR